MTPTSRGQGSARPSESPSSAATSGALHFLENVPFAAIFVADAALVPIPNAAARTLLRIDAPGGHPTSEILGLLGVDAPRLAAGSAIRWETTVGGDPRLQLFVTSSPFRDASGNRVGALFTIADVTEERDASDLQGSFVSTVAHELRTPLAALRGFMDNLRDGIEGPLNAGQRECVLRMQRISERLVGLLDGLLKLSKLQAGMVPCRVQETDVAGIVGESVMPFQREATERGLRLNTLVAASLPTIQSDGDRIIQVLTNLVSNAIKHTPRGGEVTVRATTVRESTLRALERLGSITPAGRASDWVQLSVEDDGEGISSEEIDRIFDPFYQASSHVDRGHADPGVGLGLAICKEILRALQGHIFVESTLGKGTTFTFVLPVRLESAATAATSGKENAHV